ncbi:MAG: MBL fold metallo-hydrolase [Desulfomonile tiedjei]|nr:MBL fold metallo-hydrolase [Desulfomonile tiedjei]
MSDEISRRGFFKFAGATALAVGSVGITAEAFGQSKEPAAGPAAEVKAHAFLCGILKTQTQLLLKDTRVGTPFDIPVTFFVIKHGKDWVAFDTGNNAMVAKDPVAYWGEPVTKAYYPVMKDYEEFQAQIKKLGIGPKDLKAVIISHGHLDHAGAIDNFKGTDVPIYLQKKELELIKKAVASGTKTAYIPGDFKVMDQLNIKPIEGVFDLFGDQTVVAFPTPGHTEGHQSLLVKQTGGKSLILAADAMYTLENMQEAIPPGLAWDVPQSLQALYVFKAMKYVGAEVVPSHDPDYWKNQPLAPKTFKS